MELGENMGKVVLIIDLICVVVAFGIFLPTYLIYSFSKKMNRLTFVKISLVGSVIMTIGDSLKLDVLAYNHQPTNILIWINPVIWTVITILYYAEYTFLKKEESKTTSR